MDNPKNRSLTLWEKSNKTYDNYKIYLDKKTNKLQLTLIDLLYVSNFKGGNATINEFENEINEKLKCYSKILVEINEEFKDKQLRDLSENELRILNEKLLSIFELVKNPKTKIDGFSYSYLTALLHFYFPELLPILDRRVLINLGIVNKENRKQVDKYGQIKNIEIYYEELIRKIKRISQREKDKSLRQIDKDLFIIKI